MNTIKIQALYLCILAAFTTSTYAASLNDSQVKLAKKAAQSEQWRHLLHYHQAGIFSTYRSQVDDPNFFLASDGADSPENELIATLESLLTDNTANEPIQCKFPARTHWLKQNLPTIRWPHRDCAEFETWFKKIDGASLTLIFPAAYLNSPSSMYGHTLIRINRKSGGNHLLDYSINYAANADPADNELLFSIKGLSGGYPGVFTVLPYYEKVNEYSGLEARDIWEYDLSLNQDEVDQFLRHTWEIKDAYFDYYFFTENCSYHLLTILDASSERFDLSDEFYASAIPSDTVRVVAEAELITDATFRPSKLNEMMTVANTLTTEKLSIARTISTPDSNIDEQLSPLSNDDKVKVLDLAYKYSRYLSIKKKQRSKAQHNHSIKLLSARSKLKSSETLPLVQVPKVRDDQGHGTRRATIGYGYSDLFEDYVDISIRMAYHDLLDPTPGYLKGANLEMFHLQLRQYTEEQQSSPQVQHLEFIDIASLSNRSELIRPISWRVSTGITRLPMAATELLPYLTTGFGVSYGFNQVQYFALLDTQLNADNDINKGFFIGSGPSMGVIYQSDKINTKLEFNKIFKVDGADFEKTELNLGLSFSPTRSLQLRIESNYSEFKLQESTRNKYEKNITFSTGYYF